MIDRYPAVSSGTFVRRFLIVGFTVIAALALWHLRDLVLLIFVAILFAIALRALSASVTWATGLGNGASFTLAAVIAALSVGIFFAVLGAQLQAQLVELGNRLPELLSPLEVWIGVGDMGKWLAERAQAIVNETTLISQLAGWSGAAASLVLNAVLVMVAGFYIGHRPGLYLEGFMLLFPPGLRARAQDTADALGAALGRWLVAQIVAMVVIGLLTFIGLWALGMESALALAFIAGILEFVPFLGPILATVPAVAVALTVDTMTAVWVFALYVVIQQVEGNVIAPLIMQRAVALPPAVTMFALVAFGILFGPLGLLLATPLAVVCLVAVKQLWVRDVLGEEVSLPGEDDESANADRQA